MAKSFNARMKDRFKVIATNYQKANEYVHETAMLILNHAKEHGDCSTAQELVMAMPASTRREMLILWFSTYSPIVTKNSDKHVAKMHPETSKLFRPFDIEAAEADPFYTMAERHKESPPLDFEGLVKLVEGLASRISKKVEAGEVSADDVPSAERLVAQLSGLRIQRVKPAPANTETDNPAIEEAA